MKQFIYLIIFLVFLLILKAFYLDPYLSKQFGESNTSAQTNDSIDPNTSLDQPKAVEQTSPKPYPSSSKEKMPLDKLGDSIANTLGDKIKQKQE